MRSRGLAGVASAALMLVAPTAAADDVQKGPYLQHLTSTSVDVRVELKGALPLTVLATPESRDAGRTAPPFAITSPASAFHSVHVAGLTPGTRYRYSVRAGAGAPHEGAFVTAPDDASHAPFTFVVFGDSRSDGAAHARVAAALAKESFDFLLQTGDLVIAGDDEDAWQSFFDVEEPILRDHCVFTAIGNHELHNDRVAAHYERYFGPSDHPPPDAPSVLYGSFRWGRARFFVLNAFEEWGPGKERTWLERALTDADHEPGIDLRVAVIHHGPYAAGPHGNNTRLLEAHVDDLLVAHHVDLVVSGHDHIYERGQAGALKYLVSGGAGAPLYREIKALPSTRKVEATYHYVLATVTDDGVSILAKRPDGTTVDECSFKRGGSWLCDPPKVEAKPAPASGTPLETDSAKPGAMCRCDAPGRGDRGGTWALAAAGVLAALGLLRRLRRVG